MSDTQVKTVTPGTVVRNQTTALITGKSFVDTVERLADFAAENPIPDGEWAAVYFNPVYGPDKILGYTVSVDFREAHFTDDIDL